MYVIKYKLNTFFALTSFLVDVFFTLKEECMYFCLFPYKKVLSSGLLYLNFSFTSAYEKVH